MAITLPLGIRVAAGLLGATIDRLGRLPEELPGLGVTLAGQVVRTSMRVRQELAELATRGDDLLAGLTGGAEEHPPWATFDEDDGPTNSAPTNDGVPSTPDPLPPTATPRRRATTPRSRSTPATTPQESAGRMRPAAPVTEELPTNTLRERSVRIDPGSGARPVVKRSARTAVTGTARRSGDAHIDAAHPFTVAELKERMQSLDSSAVRELLQQEESGPNRAAYLTLLGNRLATLAHENR